MASPDAGGVLLLRAGLAFLLLPHLNLGLLSDYKICGESGCESPMSRVRAVRDHAAADCRFLRFRKGDNILVHHKLTGRREDLWAGSMDKHFGHFPKDAVKEEQIFAKVEKVFETQDFDFLCLDQFDSPVDMVAAASERRPNRGIAEDGEIFVSSGEERGAVAGGREEKPEAPTTPKLDGGPRLFSWLGSLVTGSNGEGDEGRPGRAGEGREEEVGLKGDGGSLTEKGRTLGSVVSGVSDWLGFGADDEPDLLAERGEEEEGEEAEIFRSRKFYQNPEDDPVQEEEEEEGRGVLGRLAGGLAERFRPGRGAAGGEAEKNIQQTSSSWFDLGFGGILGGGGVEETGREDQDASGEDHLRRGEKEENEDEKQEEEIQPDLEADPQREDNSGSTYAGGSRVVGSIQEEAGSLNQGELAEKIPDAGPGSEEETPPTGRPQPEGPAEEREASYSGRSIQEDSHLDPPSEGDEKEEIEEEEEEMFELEEEEENMIQVQEMRQEEDEVEQIREEEENEEDLEKVQVQGEVEEPEEKEEQRKEEEVEEIQGEENVKKTEEEEEEEVQMEEISQEKKEEEEGLEETEELEEGKEMEEQMEEIREDKEEEEEVKEEKKEEQMEEVKEEEEIQGEENEKETEEEEEKVQMEEISQEKEEEEEEGLEEMEELEKGKDMEEQRKEIREEKEVDEEVKEEKEEEQMEEVKEEEEKEEEIQGEENEEEKEAVEEVREEEEDEKKEEKELEEVKEEAEEQEKGMETEEEQNEELEEVKEEEKDEVKEEEEQTEEFQVKSEEMEERRQQIGDEEKMEVEEEPGEMQQVWREEEEEEKGEEVEEGGEKEEKEEGDSQSSHELCSSRAEEEAGGGGGRRPEDGRVSEDRTEEGGDEEDEGTRRDEGQAHGGPEEPGTTWEEIQEGREVTVGAAEGPAGAEGGGAFSFIKHTFGFFGRAEDVETTEAADLDPDLGSSKPEPEPIGDHRGDPPDSSHVQPSPPPPAHSSDTLLKDYQNLLSLLTPGDARVLVDLFGRTKLQFLDYILGGGEDPGGEESILRDIEALLHHHRRTLSGPNLQQDGVRSRTLAALHKLETLLLRGRGASRSGGLEIAGINQGGGKQGPDVDPGQVHLSDPTGTVVSSLPDDLQPGPDLYGVPWEPIIITSLVGLVTVLLFTFRCFSCVKSRMYRSKERRMAEQLAQLLDEKSKVLETLSKCQQEHDELEDSLSDSGVLAQTQQTRQLEGKARQLELDKSELEEDIKQLKEELDVRKEERMEREMRITHLEESMKAFEEETKELQSQQEQADTTLKVYNMNSDRLQRNLEKAEAESTLLRESNTQLRQQKEGWAERVSELEEEMRRCEVAHSGMLQDVANKDERIMSLTDRLLGMKAWDSDVEAEEGDKAGDRETSSGTVGSGDKNGPGNTQLHLQRVQNLIYAAKLNADLKSVGEDKDRVFAKLNDEVKAKEDLQVSIKELEKEKLSMHSDAEHFSDQVQRLQQKLHIMTEMYQENELKLHRLLTVEEKERLQKEEKLSKADKNIALAIEELNNYRHRAEEMEDELEKTKQSYQTQISAHEKKAHNNWLAARAADRELTDIKRENALLRRKLTETQLKLDALNKDPYALDSLARPLPFQTDRPPYGPSPLGRPASETRALLSPPTLLEGPLRLSPRVSHGPPEPPAGQGEMERSGPLSDSGSISPSWERDRWGPPPGPLGHPGYMFTEGPVYRRPPPPPMVMGRLPPPGSLPLGPPLPHPRVLPPGGPPGPHHPAEAADGTFRENSLAPGEDPREPGDRRSPPESDQRMGGAPPPGPPMGPMDGPFPRRAPYRPPPPDFYPPRGPGGPPLMQMWPPPPSGMRFPPRFLPGGPPHPPMPFQGPPMRPPPPDGFPPPSMGPPPPSRQPIPFPPLSQSAEEPTPSPQDAI